MPEKKIEKAAKVHRKPKVPREAKVVRVPKKTEFGEIDKRLKFLERLLKPHESSISPPSEEDYLALHSLLSDEHTGSFEGDFVEEPLSPSLNKGLEILSKKDDDDDDDHQELLNELEEFLEENSDFSPLFA